MRVIDNYRLGHSWVALLVALLLLTACGGLATTPSPTARPTETLAPTETSTSSAPTATRTPRATRTPMPTLHPTHFAWTDDVTVTAVLTPASSAPPAWSPDGQGLALDVAEGLALAYAPDFLPQTVYTGPVSGAMWGEPGILWHPDGTEIVFRTSAEREVNGKPLSVGTLGSIAPDGSDVRDLLPGWKAATNGPSFGKGLVGWLDNQTFAFHAHCGTECEYLHSVDLATGDLLDLHTYGPRFYVQLGNPWIVAQHGPSGRMDFILVHRDSATIADPQTAAPAWLPPAAITRTLPLPDMHYSQFMDWAPDGQRLLALAWDQGWMPLVETVSDLYLWDVADDMVTLFAPHVLAAAWSPDGQYIALLVPGEPIVRDGKYRGTDYTLETPLSYSTVVIDADDRTVRFVAEGPTTRLDALDFFYGRLRLQWSPEGSLLLYSNVAGDLAYYNPSTEASAPLTQDSGPLLLGVTYLNITFSPDERYLALTYSNQYRQPPPLHIVDVSGLTADD